MPIHCDISTSKYRCFGLSGYLASSFSCVCHLKAWVLQSLGFTQCFCGFLRFLLFFVSCVCHFKAWVLWLIRFMQFLRFILCVNCANCVNCAPGVTRPADALYVDKHMAPRYELRDAMRNYPIYGSCISFVDMLLLRRRNSHMGRNSVGKGALLQTTSDINFSWKLEKHGLQCISLQRIATTMYAFVEENV